ncbi:galactose-1-phosphate uridylyltransferase [Candidatus Aerophobetes bacterium]|nr:galactose-1-phosphate uridylyltransferase [Candidatus Aerophobetes bacterium]
MAELRKDPVIGRWVIVSTDRGRRPSDFVLEETPRVLDSKSCPFCEGNEAITPPEILSYRKCETCSNSPGWWIRVVPNKFPALRIEGELNKRGKGIYDLMNGIGAHEVIIETPQHVDDIFSLEQKAVEDVIWVYRERMIDLMKDVRFEYVLIFKNKGRDAGASLDHPHSQLIATPIVPKRVEEEIEGAKKYFDFKQRCVFCDVKNQEVESKERLLWQDENFVSFCPFASRFPYEMSILPKNHSSDFRKINEAEVKSLAWMLKKCINSLNEIIPGVPYNYIIHTSPSNKSNLKYYHWHLEVMPRLTSIAGFEWGTGFYINYVPPEEAAKHLKQEEKINP